MDDIKTNDSISKRIEKPKSGKSLCGCLIIDECGCIEDACALEASECNCYRDPCACEI